MKHSDNLQHGLFEKYETVYTRSLINSFPVVSRECFSESDQFWLR